MELVPEEKPVVITTEKPILSPSNKKHGRNSSLEIEITLTNLLSLVISNIKLRKI